MASRLKGIPITYYSKTKTGVDAFNRDTFTDTAETIYNVLVAPVGTNDLTDVTNLSETILQYDMYIPKGDVHEWRNVEVEFLGKRWKTVGDAQEWIESMVPLDWNRKVRVVICE